MNKNNIKWKKAKYKYVVGATYGELEGFLTTFLPLKENPDGSCSISFNETNAKKYLKENFELDDDVSQKLIGYIEEFFVGKNGKKLKKTKVSFSNKELAETALYAFKKGVLININEYMSAKEIKKLKSIKSVPVKTLSQLENFFGTLKTYRTVDSLPSKYFEEALSKKEKMYNLLSSDKLLSPSDLNKFIKDFGFESKEEGNAFKRSYQEYATLADEEKEERMSELLGEYFLVKGVETRESNKGPEIDNLSNSIDDTPSINEVNIPNNSASVDQIDNSSNNQPLSQPENENDLDNTPTSQPGNEDNLNNTSIDEVDNADIIGNNVPQQDTTNNINNTDNISDIIPEVKEDTTTEVSVKTTIKNNQKDFFDSIYHDTENNITSYQAVYKKANKKGLKQTVGFMSDFANSEGVITLAKVISDNKPVLTIYEQTDNSTTLKISEEYLSPELRESLVDFGYEDGIYILSVQNVKMTSGNGIELDIEGDLHVSVKPQSITCTLDEYSLKTDTKESSVNDLYLSKKFTDKITNPSDPAFSLIDSKGKINFSDPSDIGRIDERFLLAITTQYGNRDKDGVITYKKDGMEFMLINSSDSVYATENSNDQIGLFLVKSKGNVYIHGNFGKGYKFYPINESQLTARTTKDGEITAVLDLTTNTSTKAKTKIERRLELPIQPDGRGNKQEQRNKKLLKVLTDFIGTKISHNADANSESDVLIRYKNSTFVLPKLDNTKSYIAPLQTDKYYSIESSDFVDNNINNINNIVSNVTPEITAVSGEQFSREPKDNQDLVTPEDQDLVTEEQAPFVPREPDSPKAEDDNSSEIPKEPGPQEDKHENAEIPKPELIKKKFNGKPWSIISQIGAVAGFFMTLVGAVTGTVPLVTAGVALMITGGVGNVFVSAYDGMEYPLNKAVRTAYAQQREKDKKSLEKQVSKTYQTVKSRMLTSKLKKANKDLLKSQDKYDDALIEFNFSKTDKNKKQEEKNYNRLKKAQIKSTDLFSKQSNTDLICFIKQLNPEEKIAFAENNKTLLAGRLLDIAKNDDSYDNLKLYGETLGSYGMLVVEDEIGRISSIASKAYALNELENDALLRIDNELDTHPERATELKALAKKIYLDKTARNKELEVVLGEEGLKQILSENKTIADNKIQEIHSYAGATELISQQIFVEDLVNRNNIENMPEEFINSAERILDKSFDEHDSELIKKLQKEKAKEEIDQTNIHKNEKAIISNEIDNIASNTVKKGVPIVEDYVPSFSVDALKDSINETLNESKRLKTSKNRSTKKNTGGKAEERKK